MQFCRDIVPSCKYEARQNPICWMVFVHTLQCGINGLPRFDEEFHPLREVEFYFDSMDHSCPDRSDVGDQGAIVHRARIVGPVDFIEYGNQLLASLVDASKAIEQPNCFLYFGERELALKLLFGHDSGVLAEKVPTGQSRLVLWVGFLGNSECGFRLTSWFEPFDIQDTKVAVNAHEYIRGVGLGKENRMR